jgi:hypothetical protein
VSPDLLDLHSRRFRRMLQDLALDPGALIVDRDHALWDAVTDRRVTIPLRNQTLAEGLVSAIKLAAAFA